MAKYYFHIRDQDGGFPDEEGQDFATPEEAKAAAIQFARELASETAKAGTLKLDRSLDVQADGKTIFSVSLSEAATTPPECDAAKAQAGS